MDSVKPTRQWSIEFEEILDWVNDEKERAIVANIISEIRSSLERGDELTKAFRICSPLENLLPATELGAASKTYTRPVLILTNEFSASMADAFPAILQDAGNAKVFGAQTMGLGGGVIEVGPLGNSDITIYMTNSLAWRDKDVLLPATELGAASKTYTRPVLILTNEFSASMADAFPAILQDAGNAKVFGAQTMGLGGGVIEVGPLGNSDITIYMTNSLAWRDKDVLLPSGETTRFIENVGVIPDYPYDVTLDDFLNGYSGYRAAVENALANMLKNTSSDRIITIYTIPTKLTDEK